MLFLHIRNKALFLALILALVPPDPSWALGLEDAVKEAASQSPQIRAAKARLQAGKAQASAESALANPTVEVVSYSGNDYTATPDKMEISASYPISELWQWLPRRSASNWSYKAQEQDFEIMRMQLRAAVRQWYFALAQSEARKQLGHEQIELATRMRIEIQKQRDDGHASYAQILRGRIEENRSRAFLLAAEQASEEATLRLNQLLGRKLSAKTIATDALNISETEISQVRLLELFKNGPVSKRAEFLEKAAQAQKNFAYVSLFDQVEISYGVRGADETAISVGAEIPIFNMKWSTRKMARLLRDAASYDRKATRIELEFEASNLSKRLAVDIKMIQTLNSTLEAAAENLSLSQLSYQEGEGSLVYLLDAKKSYFETKVDYLEAVLAYKSTLGEAEALAGKALDVSSENMKKEILK